VTNELQNIGNDSASLVTTKLILPNGFSSSQSYSETANLGTITKDLSKTATYYINIDKNIQPGKHKAQLIINYKFSGNNSNEYKQKIIDFDLDVKDEPKLTIEKIEISQANGLMQGDKSEIKLTIKNIGNKVADEVSVKIFKQSDQPFEFDKKYDYIGKLESNENGQATITFTVNNDAALKEYFIKTEIRYLTNDTVKTTDEQFTINVNKEKPKDQLTTIVIVLVVLIIAGVVVWKKVLKK
jgi:hypothetical protein